MALRYSLGVSPSTRLSSVLFVSAALAACGGDDVGAPTPSVGRAIANPVDAKPTTSLVVRDTPLEVGATAPDFVGLPPGAKTVVVFYRGHW